MNRRIYGVAAAVVALGTVVPGAAFAAGSKKASGSMTSCIDYNNNGTCDAGDASLTPLLDSGVIDTTHLTPPANRPATAATAAPIGVVLGNLRVASRVGLIVSASGNVTVAGKVTMPNDSGPITVQSHGSIKIGDSAVVNTGENGGRFVTDADGSVSVGASAKLQANGVNSRIVIAAGDITIGDRASITARGEGANVAVRASGRLTVGENVTIQGAGAGEGTLPTVIEAASDITLDHAKLAGSGVWIIAKGTPGSAARHINVSNSTVKLVHDEDSLVLQADPGTDGVGSNVLDDVRLNPANAHIDASPAASITNASTHRHG